MVYPIDDIESFKQQQFLSENEFGVHMSDWLVKKQIILLFLKHIVYRYYIQFITYIQTNAANRNYILIMKINYTNYKTKKMIDHHHILNIYGIKCINGFISFGYTTNFKKD